MMMFRGCFISSTLKTRALKSPSSPRGLNFHRPPSLGLHFISSDTPVFDFSTHQTNRPRTPLWCHQNRVLSLSNTLPSLRIESSIFGGDGWFRRDHQVAVSSRIQIRTNFSFAGPRNLSDIIKTELLNDKTYTEISDLWMTFHENKEKVHGFVLNADKGKSILSRAAQCPFFIHPCFRDEGHFMIMSQYQQPNYFLLAFLEDYKMDPSRAQPLLTISIFNDLADSKDLALVRCDIINQGIEDDEGYKICKFLIDDYSDEEKFRNIHMFNKKPDAFDVDSFVKEKEQLWKEPGEEVTCVKSGG